MTTLTEFLLARIAEDESRARSAVSALSDWDCWAAVGSDAITIRKYEVGAHIAHQSPGRVLAECERNRQIVAFAADAAEQEWWWRRTVGDPLLELLALPYADHPDYQSEWRP